MKYLALTILSIQFTIWASAQVGIGVSGSVNSSAKLEVTATDKGFLPPRVALTSTNTASNAISNPATGLLVYNTATAGTSPSNVTPGFYFYDGARWQRVINQQPDATVTFDGTNPNSGASNFSGTQQSADYVYVSNTDASQWTWSPAANSGAGAYVTYTPPASTAWLSQSSSTDAGSNKTSGIYRKGNVGIGDFSASSPASKLHIVSSTVGGGLRLVDGTQGSNKVLSSDANGNASWTTNVAVNSINKVAITAPTSSATLTISDGKTLTANNSITIAGTDGTTMSFPSTSATIARTDAEQTFTGTQTFSALKLTTAAASGKILTSDINGNASWQTGAVAIYTEVHCSINNSGNYYASQPFNEFDMTTADNVKTLYGNTYGFIQGAGAGSLGDKWVAPFTGKFRVTTNAYFNYSATYPNPRFYAYKNDVDLCNVTSANNTSQDIATSTSAIISMNQGDFINWRVQGTGASMWRGPYHTFFRVESVE